MELETLIENLTNYDTDMIIIDHQNNNFDLDNWREEIQRYHMPLIVAESWFNGQRKQARDQFARYGLTAEDLKQYDHFISEAEIISLVS